MNHSVIRIAGVLSLGLMAALVGCSGEDMIDESSPNVDNGERTPVLGKADDPSAPDCANTALDDNGVCRRSNGQFAPSACCAPASVCKNATIDAQGRCRDQVNGQFVPKSCCTALCAGAKIINRYCRYEATGRFALAACCADQCFDLQMPDPQEAPLGSCANDCGSLSTNGSCWCDGDCIKYGDCCADFADFCPDLASPPPPSPDSCKNACGGTSSGGTCWCDDACAQLGDCCVDKVAQCGGQGEDEIVACQKDECEDTRVDSNGVCRKLTGEFALSACCAPNCDNADLVIEEGQKVCRETVGGTVIAMSCCDARCADAELDRYGICRNKVNGQFADPACCADQCFVAQSAGSVSDLDACNGTQEAPAD